MNRSIAYQFPAHIGLMTFSDSDKIKLSGEISASYEAFRKNVERMHAEGDTALLDALSEGTQVTQRHGHKMRAGAGVLFVFLMFALLCMLVVWLGSVELAAEGRQRRAQKRSATHSRVVRWSRHRLEP